MQVGRADAAVQLWGSHKLNTFKESNTKSSSKFAKAQCTIYSANKHTLHQEQCFCSFHKSPPLVALHIKCHYQSCILEKREWNRKESMWWVNLGNLVVVAAIRWDFDGTLITSHRLLLNLELSAKHTSSQTAAEPETKLTLSPSSSTHPVKWAKPSHPQNAFCHKNHWHLIYLL